MGERVDLICEIRRRVSDEPQPGIVEARFIDAGGRFWVLIDKSPCFTAESIHRGSGYPRPGVVRCEVLDRRSGPTGGIARVRAIERPRTEGDVYEFEVDLSLLTSPA